MKCRKFIFFTGKKKIQAQESRLLNPLLKVEENEKQRTRTAKVLFSLILTTKTHILVPIKNVLFLIMLSQQTQ